MILTMCIRRLKCCWDNCRRIDLTSWLRRSDTGYPQKIRATSLGKPLFRRLQEEVRFYRLLGYFPLSLLRLLLLLLSTVMNGNVNIDNETNTGKFLARCQISAEESLVKKEPGDSIYMDSLYTASIYELSFKHYTDLYGFWIFFSLIFLLK